SEWTGVPLATLFREAGVKPGAKWFLAEGEDAAVMTRSIPIEKAWDDALIAYGQNGEALRPEQGYPARLLLAGWAGNANVKWLRRRAALGARRAGATRTRQVSYAVPALVELGRDGSHILEPRSGPDRLRATYPGAAPEGTRPGHPLPFQSHPSVAGAAGRRRVV